MLHDLIVVFGLRNRRFHIAATFKAGPVQDPSRHKEAASFFDDLFQGILIHGHGIRIDKGPHVVVFVKRVANAKLAIAPCTEDGQFCIFGPRFYFVVPEGVEEFTVEVDTQVTWAAYGWLPEVSVFGPDGAVADHAKGPGPLAFTLRPQAEQTGKLWSLGPLGRVSAPKVNATWHTPLRPVDSPFPAFFRLSANLPQVVSTHPELFFVP